jgi:hypothetical protein
LYLSQDMLRNGQQLGELASFPYIARRLVSSTPGTYSAAPKTNAGASRTLHTFHNTEKDSQITVYLIRYMTFTKLTRYGDSG